MTPQTLFLTLSLGLPILNKCSKKKKCLPFLHHCLWQALPPLGRCPARLLPSGQRTAPCLRRRGTAHGGLSYHRGPGTPSSPLLSFPGAPSALTSQSPSRSRSQAQASLRGPGLGLRSSKPRRPRKAPSPHPQISPALSSGVFTSFYEGPFPQWLD